MGLNVSTVCEYGRVLLHSRVVGRFLLNLPCADKDDTAESRKYHPFKLYVRKAHIHHYTEYMEECRFDQSLEALTSLTDEYLKMDRYVPPASSPRERPVV